jgi:low affinity Fe/Cu permease
MDRLFERVAQAVASWAGRPPAFALAFIIVALWGITGPIFGYSNTWQLVINTGTTIVTFLMVFLIQNAQNRDGSAIQAKLDEIIRATIDARNAFIGIEHLTQIELERIKALIEKECNDGSTDHQAIERMLGRL